MGLLQELVWLIKVKSVGRDEKWPQAHWRAWGLLLFLYIMVVIYHGLGLSFNYFCSLLNIPCFAMLDCCNHYAATLCPRFAWPVDSCVVDVDALIVWLLFDKDSAWGVYLASFLQFFYSISLMCRCGVGIYSIFDEWNQGGVVCLVE